MARSRRRTGPRPTPEASAIQTAEPAHRDRTSPYRELVAQPRHGDHLVQFYEEDAFLVETVCRYFGAGLAAGDQLVGAVTPAHRDAICARLAAAGEFQPALVLLDIGMPSLNGYETARRIRERASPACPLLIALTGWGQDEDRRRAKDAGFDFHFVKPVDFPALQQLLDRQLVL